MRDPKDLVNYSADPQQDERSMHERDLLDEAPNRKNWQQLTRG